MKPMVLKRGKGIKLVEVEYSLHNIAHRKLFEVGQKVSRANKGGGAVWEHIAITVHTRMYRYCQLAAG
jgi:hypothetical protein